MNRVVLGWKMLDENLSELDMRLFEFIKMGDYESNKWSTPNAASKLGVSEKEVYQALSNLSTHYKDHVYIYYKDGGLRIASE
ncbi:MAG: hypothetical protein QCI38_05630 [Candidatus Thermoplasmatota archaeon]|nr:hypothetical protein [Candidatus Thermoplasmatota archaeon]